VGYGIVGNAMKGSRLLSQLQKLVNRQGEGEVDEGRKKNTADLDQVSA